MSKVTKMVARRNIYKGLYVQRGNGIGTVVSSLLRHLVPFLKRSGKTILPFVKTAGRQALKSKPVRKGIRTLKRSAAVGAKEFANDLMQKRSPKANLAKNVNQTLNALENINQNPAKKRKKNGPVRRVVSRKSTLKLI